ncbi:MAG: ribosome biosis GTPase / thiamine phosphate phosphatase, partial [Gaiellaceae bacterium]|nr:ribosome biosis GTPase / thiamine phosphate phosphatase [Gaiellaceae bacterium]
MSLVSLSLERLGWTPDLEREFEIHRDAGLTAARVAQQHRGAYVLLGEEGELWAESTGRLHRDGPQPAVGDWVGYMPGTGGGRALVHEVLPRRSAFVRRAAGSAVEEQVVAANVDVVFIVTALTERDLKPRRIERYLTLTWESGADPVIVLTKADLCEDVEAMVAEVEAVALGVPIHVVSNVTGEGIEALYRWPAGNRTVALLGSSGVGKSSLVNALAGEEVLAVGEIREDGRGRHTTTHRELVPLPNGGLVLDTPGMRELQLWDADEGLAASF